MFVTGGCRGNCCRAIRLHVAEPSHDATDEVWCFCPVTLTCTPVPAMLKPRTMHTAVTCLDRIYVIGGRTKGSRGGAPNLLEVTSCPLIQTTLSTVTTLWWLTWEQRCKHFDVLYLLYFRWSIITLWTRPGAQSAHCPLPSSTLKPVLVAASSILLDQRWRSLTRLTRHWTASSVTMPRMTSGTAWWQSLASSSMPH